MSKKINIGLFNDSFFPLTDGVLMVVDNYARRMSQYANVTVFVPGYHHVQDPVQRDFPYKVVRCNNYHHISKIGYGLAMPRTDLAFSKALRESNLDIVHVHTPFEVCRAGVRYARSHNIPLIGTMHTQFYKDIYRVVHSKLLTDVVNSTLIHTYEKCDECWAVNEAVAKIYTSEYHYHGIPRIVKNATEMHPLSDMDEARSEMNAKYGIDPGAFVFLFVGRLTTNKNILFIADCIKALRDRVPGRNFKMLFVGDGPDEEKLKNHVHALGIEKDVLYAGKVTDRELMSKLYARGDLFLFPSLYDCSSLVQIEASCQKTASLFVHGAATASTATEDVNAFFADADVVSYSDKMLEIMNDPFKLNKIAANAQRDLYINWDQAVDSAYERYLELIALKKKN